MTQTSTTPEAPNHEPEGGTKAPNWIAIVLIAVLSVQVVVLLAQMLPSSKHSSRSMAPAPASPDAETADEPSIPSSQDSPAPDPSGRPDTKRGVKPPRPPKPQKGDADKMFQFEDIEGVADGIMTLETSPHPLTPEQKVAMRPSATRLYEAASKVQTDLSTIVAVLTPQQRELFSKPYPPPKGATLLAQAIASVEKTAGSTPATPTPLANARHMPPLPFWNVVQAIDSMPQTSSPLSAEQSRTVCDALKDMQLQREKAQSALRDMNAQLTTEQRAFLDHPTRLPFTSALEARAILLWTLQEKN